MLTAPAFHHFRPRSPDEHEDKEGKDNLQHSIRQGNNDLRAQPGSNDRPDAEGQHERPLDVRAQMPGPSRVGAHLHNAMHRDESRHRDGHAHDRKQRHPTTNAKRCRQRGGEKTGGDQSPQDKIGKARIGKERQHIEHEKGSGRKEIRQAWPPRPA